MLALCCYAFVVYGLLSLFAYCMRSPFSRLKSVCGFVVVLFVLIVLFVVCCGLLVLLFGF